MAAHALCSALDAPVVEQAEPAQEPDLGAEERGWETDEEPVLTDEGDEDGDTSISQEG